MISEKKLENILRKADQTNDKNSRAKLLQEAVETAETLELPMGHQGRLYDMAATAHLAASHFERAEKYFLIAINRWVQSGVGQDFLHLNKNSVSENLLKNLLINSLKSLNLRK